MSDTNGPGLESSGSLGGLPVLASGKATRSKKKGFWAGFRENELTGDFITTAVVVAALTALSYLFVQVRLTSDKLVPFRSISFLLGCGAVVYYTLFVSTRQAIYVAVAEFTIVMLIWSQRNDLSATQKLLQLPALAIFLAGLVFLPNVLPWMIQAQVQSLNASEIQLAQKVEALRHELDRIQVKDVQEKKMSDRQGQIKVSSRIASLNGFAREALQASSAQELLNLLFHNVGRVMGVEEMLLISLPPDGREGIVKRALHPDRDAIENAKVPLGESPLAQILSGERLVTCEPGTLVVGKVPVSLAIAVKEGDRVEACLYIGKVRAGALDTDDEDLLVTFVDIVEGAGEQLKASMAGGVS